MAEFVKFSVPKELADRQLELIKKLKKQGKIKMGINEITKAVERGTAKLVILAEDINPAEIAMHIPLLCDEKNIAYTYVPTKKDLGVSAGIEVGTSAVAVIDEADSKKELQDIQKKLKELNK